MHNKVLLNGGSCSYTSNKDCILYEIGADDCIYKKKIKAREYYYVRRK